jgi:hypothetical protein
MPQHETLERVAVAVANAPHQLDVVSVGVGRVSQGIGDSHGVQRIARAATLYRLDTGFRRV